MSLRRRLVLLLGLFAVYAVAAAAITIYGSQWRVEMVVKRFERLATGTAQLERMPMLLTQQQIQLREITANRSDGIRAYTAARDEFVSGLQGITSFAPSFIEDDEWSHILRLSSVLEEESNRCLALYNAGDTNQATAVLSSRVEAELIPTLRTKLNAARAKLDEARNKSARDLATTSSQILTLTTIVAVLALGLVILGTMFIRRWLIHPIAELHAATRRFSEGDLNARAVPRSHDELGALAVALNEMAASVAASEQKYRTLFSNLRDAVVICDRQGRIIEYHDSDTHLLAVDEGIHAGKMLLNVWPDWSGAVPDWSEVIRAAADEGRRYSSVDVQLTGWRTGEGNRSPAERDARFVDLLIYRVEYGDARSVAIVLRDATERRKLQHRVRRAETMEAVGTMAGGLAHDVNNLLTGVSATLASIDAERSVESGIAERIQSALRGCRRAAGLAKRLLNFASSAQGNPQVFAPGPIVETILESMEPAFLERVAVQKSLDGEVLICMDQDQFAQVILNLVKNACDAMTDAGSLRINLSAVRGQHPDHPAAQTDLVLLEVQDSGAGMAPDVLRRVFEPFFTTKSRTSVRGRGMGLAVVHAAVQNAGGFIKIQSEPGSGTTFQVYFPRHQARTPQPTSDHSVSV